MSKTKKYLVVGFVAVALFSIGYQKTIGRSLHADIKEITPLSQAISTKSSNTSPIENSKIYICGKDANCRDPFFVHTKDADEKPITGLIRELYPDNKVKRESPVKDGKIDGYYKAYYENGQLWEEVAYINGNEEGNYRKYYYDGKLMEESNYQKGNLEGLSKIYDTDGLLFEEREYKNGKMTGQYKEYYKNGQLKREANKNGHPQKRLLEKRYYPNGAIQEDIQCTDHMNGISKEYDENGKVWKETKCEGHCKGKKTCDTNGNCIQEGCDGKCTVRKYSEEGKVIDKYIQDVRMCDSLFEDEEYIEVESSKTEEKQVKNIQKERNEYYYKCMELIRKECVHNGCFLEENQISKIPGTDDFCLNYEEEVVKNKQVPNFYYFYVQAIGIGYCPYH